MNASELSAILDAAPFQCTFKAVRICARSDKAATEWDRGASHWNVTIGREGCGRLPAITTEYSMGSAHTKGPRLADVLHSLRLDARGTEGETFESWADNYGYDSDSRKAFATYEACRKIAGQMAGLFTREEVAQLDELFSDY